MFRIQRMSKIDKGLTNWETDFTYEDPRHVVLAKGKHISVVVARCGAKEHAEMIVEYYKRHEVLVACLANLLERDLIKDPDGDHMFEVKELLIKEEEDVE